jgi:endoglucanase
VAAGTAAAFAAGATFYSAVVGDQEYATTLLEHAASLFYFAESAKKTLYQKSVPAVKDWYASSGYEDEYVNWPPCFEFFVCQSTEAATLTRITIAALHLYRATGNQYYLSRAEQYFDKYHVAGATNPVDWDSKHGGVYLLGTQLVSVPSVAYSFGSGT